MDTVQRSIHGHSAMKQCGMRMAIPPIDSEKSSQESSEKSRLKAFGSTIDRSFLTVRISRNVTRPISTLNFAQLSVHSSIFSNTFIRAAIERLLYSKVKLTRFKIIWMHVTSLHQRRYGGFLVSRCIIDHLRFKGYKFIFQISKPLHSMMIWT